MPVFTRYKARLGHPTRLVASLRDGEINCLGGAREGNDVLAWHEEVESLFPRCAAANGSHSIPGFRIIKCKDKRCLACPKYITEHQCKFSITKTITTDYSRENIICHTQNVVYFLSFN